MARPALILAFIVAGIAVLFPRIIDHYDLRPPPFFLFTLYIPAVALGTRSWLRSPSFARSWPVVVCVLIAWLGLVYAGETESKRGFLIAAFLTIPLPVAALIVEQRAWWLCAKTYVYTNAAGVALALWFECSLYQGSLFAALASFGYLRSEQTGMAVSNPNQVGGQFAVASVLALILYLHSHQRQGHRVAARPAQGADRYLCAAILLGLGSILTASRGAFVAWFAGMSLLLLFGTQRLAASRLRDLLALVGMLLAMALFASNVTGLTPWGRLQERFTGDEARTLSSLGSRVYIWDNALQAWLSSPTYTLLGTGTGMAERLLAEVDKGGAVADKYGVLNRSTHSVFIEWLLSFGLLGGIPAGCMLVAMVYRARQLDVRDGAVSRLALILTVALFAATAVLYRQSSWLAPSALILAMLSPSPPARRGTRPSPHLHREESPRPLAASLPAPHGPRSLDEGRRSGSPQPSSPLLTQISTAHVQRSRQ